MTFAFFFFAVVGAVVIGGCILCKQFKILLRTFLLAFLAIFQCLLFTLLQNRRFTLSALPFCHILSL